jgi:predicted tellurium resistance membrane protein TerC
MVTSTITDAGFALDGVSGAAALTALAAPAPYRAKLVLTPAAAMLLTLVMRPIYRQFLRAG